MRVQAYQVAEFPIVEYLKVAPRGMLLIIGGQNVQFWRVMRLALVI
ncbi:MAG TPA: hypothetical protein VJ418_34225 [Streptosporangiaceae bacterium]|nr:hypothetical protein [Streptosporangiaceae bacterium]